MNEFQTSLLLIGAVVVGGVFAYNKWQERRATRAVDETFRSPHPDVLIGEGELAPRAHSDNPEDSRIEPGLSPRPLIAADRPVGDGGEAGLPVPRIDYIVELAGESPVAAASVLEHWAAMEHRFARRASLTGWSGGQWVHLTHNDSSERLQAGLQLVSRAGVVGEGELLEFRSAVETLASKLGVSARSSEMREALEAARQLDAVCAEADIQIAFHVVASSGPGFAGTKLRASAESSGFVLGGDGRFTLVDDRGRELYAISDRGGSPFAAATMKDALLHALTLSMDVPRAPDTQRTFDAMVRFGRHLATLLGGVLVDDNNQPLDDRAVAAIDAQLAVVHRTLDAHGITPGSTLALRLFS